jgi:hypothetical protein
MHMALDELEQRVLLVSSVQLDLQLAPNAGAALSSLTQMIATAGATIQPTTISGLYVIEGPLANGPQLAAELSLNPAVQYAVPMTTFHSLQVPNDPKFTNGNEWQLNGTWGINAPVAWDTTTGSNQVIVADTDTGMMYDHADLSGNVWINQAEIPSSVLPNLTDVNGDGVITFSDLNAVVNGVKVNQGPGKITDTNADGLITATDLLAPSTSGGWASGSTQDGATAFPDDLIGWNFVANTNNPIDQAGHGTFTAGEIGAVGNNAIGVAGTAWTVQVMPAQFLDSTGSGTDVAGAEAIEFAVDHGAKVINASWGGSGTSPTIAAAIQYANEHGVIIVAAAGNNATNDDTNFFAPASYSYQYPNLISVAAIGSNGALASFSNYGTGTVQLAAPGVTVVGTTLNGSYGTMSGTSMAAPLVSGTVALVEAAHPTWSMSQVIDAVLDHTTPDAALAGKVTTGGIVNAGAAVANTVGPYVVSGSPDGSVNDSSGFSTVRLTFNEEIDPSTFTGSQVSLIGPGGGIGPLTVTAVSGSNDHKFDVTFPAQTAAGAYTLNIGTGVHDWYGNALNQNRNLVNGETSDAFVETILQTAPGSSDLLLVTGIPTGAAAGTSQTFTVTALSPNGGTDTSYLGTIQFSSADPQAVLPVNYTFTAANAGTHTFTVTFKTAGTQAITATDTASSAIIGTEENIIVQPAAASSLKVTGFPTPDTAGAAQTFTVTAYDAFGNVATGYTGTVHFTSSDSQAALPANFTITPEELGTFLFSATLKTAGNQSITATDTTTGSITGSESNIVVQAAALKALAVTGFPSSVTAGLAQNFTASAVDQFGNVISGYTGTVQFTSNDPLAVLPANYTFLTTDNGTHIFSATLKSAGTRNLKATDTVTSSLTGTESGIVVKAAAASAVKVTGFPTSETAGTSGNVTVTAFDTFGNVATGYTGVVSLTSSDSQASLPPSYTFAAGDAGVHLFAVTLKTVGTQSITATDTSSLTASETGIVVKPASSSLLKVTGFPTSDTAGTSGNLTVTAYDPYGNVATAYAGKVSLTSSDSQAVLPPSYTFVAGDAGAHSFAVTLKTAGTQSITATDTSSLTGAETGIVVKPVAASSLKATGFPASDTAGTSGNLTVTAFDPYGNVATGYTGKVSISSSDSQAVLPSSYTFGAGDAGVHSFAVTLKTAGTQSITATDTASLTAAESGIIVTPAAGSVLKVTGYPTSAAAGTPGDVRVAVFDSYGNVETGYTGTVSFSSSDPQAVLPASYTFTATDAGVHNFLVTLKTVATQSITATDTAGLTGTESNIIVQAANDAWQGYGNSPQHTALSTVASQALGSILWQTPVDLNPQYNGDDLLIHYGSPLMTASNTVIVPVKTGTSSGFEIEAFSGSSGALLWTLTSDYNLQPSGYSWVPSYSPTLTPQNGLYFAADGGTVMYTASPDAAGPNPPATTRMAFFGISSYNSNSSTYNSNVFIDTPITTDASGDIFFGFIVTGSNPAGLTSGVARIDANGTGSWAPVVSGMSQVATNAAPALSNDGNTLYVLESTGDWGTGKLVALNSHTLAVTAQVSLKDPHTGNLATIINESTASPMVGPDGDVYVGVLESPFASNNDRGWLLHFSGDLSTMKTPGAFGWDDTPSVVPAAMVPSYHGPSTYLLMVKYNNYAGLGSGNGLNRIGVVDPNATETDPVTGTTVMNEVLTILGPTLDSGVNQQTYPGAVREWCINSAAVDPATDSILAGSEDGKLYRWNLTSNTFTQVMTLTPGIGEAYTPTMIGPDGMVYAINNATLFAIGDATAASLKVTGFPSAVTAGAANNFAVTVYNAEGDVDSAYTGTVHFTSTDLAAGLPATYTFVAADHGTHTFSATLKTAGPQSITATDTSSLTASETGIVVKAAAASALKATGFPTSVTAGTAGSLTVTAFDPYGNVATGYTGKVSISSSDLQAVLPSSYTFAAGDAGVHRFSVTLKTVGTQSITATDAANLTGTESGIVVNAVATSTLKVTGFPTSVVAGTAGSLTVTALDSNGNVMTSYTGTVSITSSDPRAVLPSTYTFVAADAGKRTFSVTLKTAGTQSITATDTSSLTGTESNIQVQSAAATTLNLTGIPTTVTAGTTNSFTVTATDPYGNLATGYTGKVQFTSNDPNASLPAAYTFTAADGGTHSFSATLVTAGTRNLKAADTVTTSLSVTVSNINVVPGAAQSFTFTGFPSPDTAGVFHYVTITAFDAYSNVATNYTGKVHFSSSDPLAVLPADTTFTAANSGKLVVPVWLERAGVQSITVADTVASSLTATQSNITVQPAAAASLKLTSFPATLTAGTTTNFTLTATDTFGNLATSYTGKVQFTSNDPNASLPAAYTFTAADGGTHSFSATLVTAGTRIMKAADTVTSALSVTTPNINVVPGAAKSFTLTGFPSPDTAGVFHYVTITAFDAYSNVATGYTGTVHFSSSDPLAILPADTAVPAANSGKIVLPVWLKTAGMQSITVADTVTSNLTATQSNITVQAAVAATLTLTGFPTTVTAGTTQNFSVVATDPYGNVATGYTGTVQFTSNDPGASLPSAYTFTAADAGTHNFSATLVSLGTRYLKAADTVNTTLSATVSNINVVPAATQSLSVTGFPTSVVAGTAGSVTVTALGPNGNVLTSYTGTVSITSSDPRAVLPSTYTFVAADSGKHTFSVTLKTAGTQSITATDTSSLTGKESNIQVQSAAATTLYLTGIPTTVTAGTTNSFTVTATDPYGNLATGYTGKVQFTSNDPNASLPAAYTFTAADGGTHSFSATLVTAGTRNLKAADTVTTSLSVTVSNINVVPGAAQSFTFTGFPSPDTAGVFHYVTITAFDAYSNVATNYTGKVHFSSSDPLAVLPADTTFTAANSGKLVVPVWLERAGVQSITVADTVASSLTATQSNITVQPAAAASLKLTSFPATLTAGTTTNFTLTATDTFGNLATSYTGKVQFTSNDPNASLPAAYTFTAADGGTHSFSATLVTAGTRIMKAADTVTSALSVTTPNINVVPGAAKSFTLTGFPSPDTAGVFHYVTITAFDAYSNVATGYTGTVHFSSSDPLAILPADTAVPAANSGKIVLPVWLKTAGMQSITVADTVTSNLTATQSNITVQAAAATVLKLTGFPTTTTAGVSHTLTVTAYDPYGNVASGYLGTVNFSSSDSAASLPASYMFAASDNGSHTFTVTLNTKGTRSITVTDSTGTPSGSQTGIIVQ